MNLSSLLTTSTASGAQSGGVLAGASSGSGTSGAFDALVTAKACATGEAVSASSLPSAPEAAMATDSSFLPAATLAMLAALDRSATMLAQPLAADAALTTATSTDDQTDPASPVDAGNTILSPQTAALISAFMAVGQAVPAIVSGWQEKAPKPDATTPLVPSAPKAPPPAPAQLSVAAMPMPALFNAIAGELRSVATAKGGLAGKAVDVALEPVKDSSDGVSVVSPTSAMIRDLASMIANSVTPSTPADGVAVDRHLDLARGDAWLSDLANDIAATAANGGRLKFGLSPESFGRLDVEIRQGEAGVSVHMTTRSETARDVLTAAQPRIVEEIRAQGVRVAGTEVSTDASGFGGDRAGTTPRQPLGMPIDVALSAPNVAASETSKSVADGRYA